MTVTVKYSCKECGLEAVTCEVPARESGQDVVAWMQGIGYQLSRDHDRRSPGCKPTALSDLMIPIEGADYIGGPSVQ